MSCPGFSCKQHEQLVFAKTPKGRVISSYFCKVIFLPVLPSLNRRLYLFISCLVLELESISKGNVLLVAFIILYAINLELIGLHVTPATCNEVHTMHGAVETLIISFALESAFLLWLMLSAGDALP